MPWRKKYLNRKPKGDLLKFMFGKFVKSWLFRQFTKFVGPFLIGWGATQDQVTQIWSAILAILVIILEIVASNLNAKRLRDMQPPVVKPKVLP
jgi:hypothetical protein